MTVEAWLERDVAGRLTRPRAEQLLERLITSGWAVAPTGVLALASEHFAAQLERVRERRPDLLDAEPPDIWLGEY
jgi:hypothetical protein